MSLYICLSVSGINSLRPGEAYMRHNARPSSNWVIVCHLYHTKPLPEPILISWHLNPWKITSVDLESWYIFPFRKIHLIMVAILFRPQCVNWIRNIIYHSWYRQAGGCPPQSHSLPIFTCYLHPTKIGHRHFNTRFMYEMIWTCVISRMISVAFDITTSYKISIGKQPVYFDFIVNLPLCGGNMQIRCDPATHFLASR